MRNINFNFIRNLALAAIFSLGILGIIASGSSSSDGFDCQLEISKIVATSDGSDDIWVSLVTNTDDGSTRRIVRLDASGNLKASYVIGDADSDNRVRDLAMANDGSGDIFVAGDFSGGILRLNRDASIDNNFITGVGFDNSVLSLAPAIDGSGSIYAAGKFTDYDNTGVEQIVRLEDDGIIDGFFNPAGIGNVTAIAVATDGSFDLYYADQNTQLARLDDTGADSLGFFAAPSGVDSANQIALATDGSFDAYVAAGIELFRYNDDGSRDLAFDIGTGFNGDVLSIAPATDGSGAIYAGGRFTGYDDDPDANPARGVVRIEATGDRDANFILDKGTDPSESRVRSIANATDGSTDIFIGGNFDAYNGTDKNGIARLNADGSVDNSFAVKIKADGGECED